MSHRLSQGGSVAKLASRSSFSAWVGSLQGAQPVLLIRESSCPHIGSNQHCTDEVQSSLFEVARIAEIGMELRNQGLLNTGCSLLMN